MSALAAREAYRLWAPSYEAETVVSRLEDELVRGSGISTTGLRLLDVGCGTARRLQDVDAAFAIGVDVTYEMLSRARRGPSSGFALTNGDARALPFASDTFDVVWCRLMIGHVGNFGAVIGELGRVCAPGGVIVVTDLSADAVTAGHRRTFRDADDVVREVEHHVHDAAEVDAFALQRALVVETRWTGVVGESVRDLYASAGRMDLFERQCGTSLVTAASYRRMSA